MKNADWAMFVVPVLAMIGWPLLIAAAGAGAVVAVSSDIAYWTWESMSAFRLGLRAEHLVAGDLRSGSARCSA